MRSPLGKCRSRLVLRSACSHIGSLSQCPLSTQADISAASGFDPLRTLAVPTMLLKMRLTRKASIALLIACSATLTGCDPGVHVAWENNFDGPINPECVESGLRTVAPDVTRTSYVDDGNGPRGFGRGVTVTQFNYSDPNNIGAYALDIARMHSGRTRYWHQWGKLGTDVPADEQAKVVPLLNRANQAVALHCGLSFAGKRPEKGGG